VIGDFFLTSYSGCVLNQIRTLKRYSWLASSAIWLNILVIFLSVGFIAHSSPNYKSAKAAYNIDAGPVVTQAFASYPFYERINGVMNIVYAYGGATIFPQIIAEMRRPMDFLKAFTIAQALIFAIYVFCECVPTPECHVELLTCAQMACMFIRSKGSIRLR
jgi:hypothetical protein